MSARGVLPVPALVQRLRDVVERDGVVPSRNRVMAEFRVGARKAGQALAELAAEPAPDPSSEPVEPGLVAPDPAGSQPADVGAELGRRVRSWPLVVLAVPAFVAIWSGWVGLGGLTGFGTVQPLPGIADRLTINTAITLPIGVEAAYAAYALNVWLGGAGLNRRARRFAKWSALGALGLGALGQVAFHVMTAAGMTSAPWPITTVVACLPVVVLGCGAALRHLVHADD